MPQSAGMTILVYCSRTFHLEPDEYLARPDQFRIRVGRPAAQWPCAVTIGEHVPAHQIDTEVMTPWAARNAELTTVVGTLNVPTAEVCVPIGQGRGCLDRASQGTAGDRVPLDLAAVAGQSKVGRSSQPHGQNLVSRSAALRLADVGVGILDPTGQLGSPMACLIALRLGEIGILADDNGGESEGGELGGGAGHDRGLPERWARWRPSYPNSR